MRDIYDDNIFDVNSTYDLDNKKSFDILAKTDKHILFEYGNDFFRLDRLTNELVQFADFKSLKDENNGKTINSSEITVDYAPPLVNAIKQNKELNNIDNFSLKDRTEYIKGSIKDFHYSFYSNRDLKDKSYKKREIDQSLEAVGSAIETKETKALTDIYKATISMVSTLLLFWKPVKIEKEKNRIIKDVKRRLENKELNIQDLYSNKTLLSLVPELNDLLEKYANKTFSGTIDLSISDILNDPDVINVANKVANEHADEIANTLYDNLTTHFNKDYDDIEQLIRDSHDKSGLSIDDFIQEKAILNCKSVLENNPKVEVSDFEIYTKYLYSILDPSKKDKINTSTLSEDQNFELANLTSIVEITFEQEFKITKTQSL